MVHETNAQEGEMEFAPRTKWEALIIDVWMYVRTTSGYDRCFLGKNGTNSTLK